MDGMDCEGTPALQTISSAHRSRDSWMGFAQVHAALAPPLRPSCEDVQHFRTAVGTRRKVLLLGTTPELAGVGEALVAIDSSAEMLARIWPGDTSRQRGIHGSWSDLPFADKSFDALMGDGTLNAAADDIDRLLPELTRVKADDAPVVFRVFCSPDVPETEAAIRGDIQRKRVGNFHALKWRIAMLIAAHAQDRIVRVSEILAAFETMFSDREDLASSTGWQKQEINTIDAYREAEHSLWFPTLAEVTQRLSEFGPAMARWSSDYALAERCPIISWSP